MVSALVFRAIKVFFPGTHFDLGGALLYGFSLAVLWGFVLMLWEKKDYKYGIEYFYCRILRRFGESAKEDKLRGGAA
jgi:predicted tellurium resistance membrane protein TerC